MCVCGIVRYFLIQDPEECHQNYVIKLIITKRVTMIVKPADFHHCITHQKCVASLEKKVF